MRLGRAALFAFGTSAVALASAACSSSSGPEVHSNVDAYGGPPEIPDSGHSDAKKDDAAVRADAFMGGTLYGGSPVEEDSGVPMGGAAYGASPAFDAGDN